MQLKNMKIFGEFYKSKTDKKKLIELRSNYPVLKCVFAFVEMWIMIHEIIKPENLNQTHTHSQHSYTLKHVHRNHHTNYFAGLFHVYILLLQVSNCS